MAPYWAVEFVLGGLSGKARFSFCQFWDFFMHTLKFCVLVENILQKAYVHMKFWLRICRAVRAQLEVIKSKIFYTLGPFCAY